NQPTLPADLAKAPQMKSHTRHTAEQRKMTADAPVSLRLLPSQPPAQSPQISAEKYHWKSPAPRVHGCREDNRLCQIAFAGPKKFLRYPPLSERCHRHR